AAHVAAARARGVAVAARFTRRARELGARQPALDRVPDELAGLPRAQEVAHLTASHRARVLLVVARARGHDRVAVALAQGGLDRCGGGAAGAAERSARRTAARFARGRGAARASA